MVEDMNDALISTDVDRLIQILSSRGSTNMRDLELATKLDRKEIEKWLHVLEDEGHISIDYKLTNMVVLWKGPREDTEINNKHENVDVKELRVDGTELKSLVPELTSPADDPPENDMPNFEGEGKFKIDEPEAKLEKLEEDNVEEDIRTSILESLKDDETEKTIEIPVEENEAGKRVAMTSLVKDMRENQRLPEASLSITREAKGLLNTRLNEISKQKHEIAAIQEDKARLYQEGYVGLQNRMNADLALLTERVLEKETRVIELKERLLDLPDRVEEIEKLNRKATLLTREGRKTLDENKQRIRQFLDNLEQEQDKVGKQLEDGKRKIADGKEQNENLLRSNEDLNETIEQLKRQMDHAQKQIEQLNERLSEINTTLQSTVDMKADIAEVTARVSNAVESKEEEMHELEQALEEIKKVSQWAQEYITDYDNKIQGIEEYVARSEEELAKLREAAETEYMRRYLRELEGFTKDYQGEFSGIVESEKSLDKRLDEAREKLMQLIAESQQTVRRLSKTVSESEEFEVVAGEIKQKTADKKAMIEEKEQEREKIVGETKKVREKKKKRSETKRGKKK